MCGCDGIGYDNDCLRRAASVLKLKEGLCGGPPDGSMGGQSGSGGSLGGGGATTTATGGVSGTGGSTAAVDAGPPGVVYSGCVWMGDLDHMMIVRQDSAQDLCLSLNLASPAANRTGYDVTLPNRWGLMWASLGSCSGAGSPTGASAVTGTISWAPGTIMGYLPDTVDVDIVVSFSVDAASGATQIFSAKGIALANGC